MKASSSSIAAERDLSATAGMDEVAGARYLGTSRKWMQTQRQLGRPPRYYKVGKLVRYRLCDLQEFQESCAREPRSGAA